MSTDRLIRALAFDGQVRVFVADTSQTVAEAQRRHDSWSVATAALGRSLTGTLFLGSMLKGEDTVTVRLQGSGPIGYMVTEANSQGQVKGHLKHPHVSLDLNDKGKLDVAKAVGLPGELIVTKDLGLKEPYVGRVDLVSGEIAEDFTYYMATSEQTPSAFGLGVLVEADESVKCAGGFMIQMMPEASEESIQAVEENLAGLPPLTTLLEQGESLEDILERLCQGGQPKVLSEQELSFHCSCSKERFADAMISLGTDDIQSMMDEDEGATATCQFCRQSYDYSMDDLKNIYQQAEGEQ